MQVHAITKNIRMSAQKMREVVRQIQGLPALDVRRRCCRWCQAAKARVSVAKTLRSAMAKTPKI